MTSLDRILSIYFFSPLLQIIKKNSLSISILMYHSISENREKKRNPYYHINTRPEVFEKQLYFLYLNKYKVISLKEALNLLKSKKISKEKYVVITFDDGYRDFISEAFPVLSKFGFIATVFIATAYIGKEFNNRACLSWNEVRFLNQNNIEFGSHTINHLQLYDMNLNSIEDELTDSKKIIEKELGSEIYSFSYPYAFPQNNRNYVNNLKNILTHCGYKIGVTTKIGNSTEKDSPLFLKRLPINSYDDIPMFRAKLNNAYNWLNNFQTLYKSIKNLKTKKSN